VRAALIWSVRSLYGIIPARWQGEDEGVTRTRVWILLGLCALLVGGCLNERLLADEVVRRAQKALDRVKDCHMVLDIEMDTDLVKDSISVEVWASSNRLKVQVLSALNPQLQDLAFSTDGERSMSYSPHANQVLVGPADVVRLPSIVEQLIAARKEWIREVKPEEARIIARERRGGLVVYRIEAPLGETGVAQYAIDAKQWWVRQIVYQDDYMGRGTITMREIECMAHIPPEQFDLDIADGVPVRQVTLEGSRRPALQDTRSVVGFALRAPACVPAGAEFSMGDPYGMQATEIHKLKGTEWIGRS
jgi:outer membrane lipoprotein-sorting protein